MYFINTEKNKVKSTEIEAEAILFSALFRKGVFSIPRHQRYFDWEVSNVKALLTDIKEAIKEKRRCYFLGTVMTVRTRKSSKSPQWEINDGQQRMVTISLICAALCQRITEVTQNSRLEAQAISILFNCTKNKKATMKDAELLKPRIKTANNNKTQYRNIIRGNPIGTNGKLKAAWDAIDNYFGHSNGQQNIVQWVDYFNFINESLEVVWLKVPMDIDTNAVFETLNCRGKSLADIDLIRNHIYSNFNISSDTERWNTVHDNLEDMNRYFKKKSESYMRCYFQSKYGFLRSKNFYSDVRGAIREDAKVLKKDLADYTFELTYDLTSNDIMALYHSLIAPNSDTELVQSFVAITKSSSKSRNLSIFLRELKGYKFTHPILFALLKRYISETDYGKKGKVAKWANKIISMMDTFVLRTAFVAPKMETSYYEREFSHYAKLIMKGGSLTVDDFKEFLKKCDQSKYNVLNDSRFQEIITTNTLNNNKAKILLWAINRKECPDADAIDFDKCSVEHILPVSKIHWAGWSKFHTEDQAYWSKRIGNLTLVSKTDNKSSVKHNKNFTKKKEIFKKSSIAMTRELSENTDWTPDAIKNRQQVMSKSVVNIWSL